MGQKRKKLIVREIFVKEQRRIEHYKYHIGSESGVNITTASTWQRYVTILAFASLIGKNRAIKRVAGQANVRLSPSAREE